MAVLTSLRRITVNDKQSTHRSASKLTDFTTNDVSELAGAFI
jgi:hypothetical protein